MFQRIKVIVLTIVIISLAFIISCFFYNKSFQSVLTAKQNFHMTNFKKRIPNTANRDIMPGTEGKKGIRYRIYNDKGEIDNRYSYFLKTGEIWSKFISISHIMDEETDYKLLLFVDFNKSKFMVDDELTEDYLFKMKPNQTIEIPVEISKLSEGLHEVLFVIVSNPYIKQFNKYNFNDNLLYLRFNIEVNNDNVPNYEITKVAQKEITDDFSGIVTNQYPNEISQPLLYKLSTNDTLSLYNHIGNSSKTNSTKCAIITLIDWKQLCSTVSYIEVGAEKEAIIPLNIQMPTNKRSSNLISILILNPYEKLNKYNNHVFNSGRIGLEIKN